MATNTSFKQQSVSRVKQRFAKSADAVFMEGLTQTYVVHTAGESTGIAKLKATVLEPIAITDSVGVPVYLGTYTVPNKFASYVMPTTKSAGDVITISLNPGTNLLSEDDVLVIRTGPGRRFGGVATFEVILTLFE